ncbi:Uncharacterised protein [Streptococcus pneumoniae]|nr:Uncharacterised protein [Streptococcus pneumoniae]
MFDISELCAPAFIYTAPPTLPGIPLANSRPANPCRLSKVDNLIRGYPPPTLTLCFSTSKWSNPSPKRITTPSIPRSDTRRFEPRPITVHFVLYFFTNCNVFSIPATCFGTIKISAGPPIFIVV